MLIIGSRALELHGIFNGRKRLDVDFMCSEKDSSRLVNAAVLGGLTVKEEIPRGVEEGYNPVIPARLIQPRQK